MSWEQQVVETLRNLKQQHYRFEDAWRMAMRRHAPSSRALGLRDGEQGALFPGEQDETHAEFLCRVCEDAWHGRRPELAKWDGSLIAEDSGL